MHKIESSCLSGLSYDTFLQELTVILKDSGRWYRYDGVPGTVYNRLAAAESVGHVYNTEVKGHFKCTFLGLLGRPV